jgi:acyl-CoA synthetase (AMP-forming)/AMP-acid ligase II
VSGVVVNVATHLADLAARQPDRAAIIHPAGRGEYRHISFRDLHAESDGLAAGLEAVGVRRGVRAALMVPPGPDFFALTFALFKVGAVPVLIDPGMGVRNLGMCLAEAGPEAFIGVPKAHLARKLLGWAKLTVRITVTTGSLFARHTLKELRQLGASRVPFPQAQTTADETAAVLFTSGSTGIAKGVVYTHGTFASQVEMLRRTYGIEPGEIDLSTFPLFALFGPALGMTAVVPEMDPTRPANVDPRKIVGAIERFGVTNLFGSPALLDRVGRFGATAGTRLPTLRRVISAGAPVPAKVVERFAALLAPGVEVFTPYGATEALPVASIGSDEILRETRALTERGCGVCVGRHVTPVRVRILPITDEPLPAWDESLCLGEGEIGEITVAGPVVTRAYFHRPEATKLAKVTDPATGEVWHRMGDVGYHDAAGRLWFCGRKSQRVVTTSGTLFTVSTEAVFNTHPDVYRAALVGVTAGGEVRPVLCVELEKTSRRPWAEIEMELRALAERFPHARAVAAFLCHPAFPVDVRHNAKIFREKLAAWAARQLRRYRWPAPVQVAPAPTAAAQPVPA